MRFPARIVPWCLLAFMPCHAYAQEKPQKVILPIHATPQGNVLYIETKLNGKPATLLLDTGSTVSLCDWRICGKAQKATASLELGSWHTESEEVLPKDLSSISLQAGIRVDGVLGLLTMVHFRCITFNFEHRTLELEE